MWFLRVRAGPGSPHGIKDFGLGWIRETRLSIRLPASQGLRTRLCVVAFQSTCAVCVFVFVFRYVSRNRGGILKGKRVHESYWWEARFEERAGGIGEKERKRGVVKTRYPCTCMFSSACACVFFSPGCRVDVVDIWFEVREEKWDSRFFCGRNGRGRGGIGLDELLPSLGHC